MRVRKSAAITSSIVRPGYASMDRLPYSAAPSGDRTTIVCGMASTIPRASCSDNDAVAVKVLISLFSVPAGWTRVLDIRGGTVTGHSAGFDQRRERRRQLPL